MLRKTTVAVVSFLTVAAFPTAAAKPPLTPFADRPAVIETARHGFPAISLSRGRELATDAALPAGARAVSLASADFDRDGFPDLAVGYATTGGGLVVIRRGDPEAFGPTRESTLRDVSRGRFPEPFLPETIVLPVPEAPDFLFAGDFDRDGHVDVLAARRGGHALFLASGEGGSFGNAKEIAVPGAITAMAAGRKNVDAWPDVVLGVDAAEGPRLLVFDSAESIATSAPRAVSLPTAADSIALGLDGAVEGDVVVAAGGDVVLVHDAQRSLRLESVSRGLAARAVAVGDFVPDRRNAMEIAVLSADGTLRVLAHGTLDERPFRRGMRASKSEETTAGRWHQIRAPLRRSSFDAGSAALVPARLASGGGASALVLSRASARLDVEGDALESLEADAPLVAVLPMRLDVMAGNGLVVLREGHDAPVAILPTAVVTYRVNGFLDAAPGSPNCSAPSGGVSNCGTLRDAIRASNANAGADMIVFQNSGGSPINGNATLTISGDDNDALNGDLDINDSLTIVGNGAASSLVSGSFSGNCDCKVFGINQDGSHTSLAVAFTGLTVQGGNNTFAACGTTFQETGGGVDFYLTGTGNAYSMSNCTIANNQTGTAACGNRHGGGVNVDSTGGSSIAGPNLGTVTFTGCTFTGNHALHDGGGLNLYADKHDVNVTNCDFTMNTTVGTGGSENGGGLSIRHSYGGTVTVSGGTVSMNTAAGAGGGINLSGSESASLSGITISGNSSTPTGATPSSFGGGLAIAGLANAGFNTTFTIGSLIVSGNHADVGSAWGGGIGYGGAYSATLTNVSSSGNTAKEGAGVAATNGYPTNTATLTLNGGSITNNTAATDGGGIACVNSVDAMLVVNGTSITGNTAPSGGGVAVTNGAATLTKVTLTGNGGTTQGGGVYQNGGALTLSYSRVAGNTSGSATSTGYLHNAGSIAGLSNNWWGCNGDPASTAACNRVSGTAGQQNPRLSLSHTASPASICSTATSTLTASFLTNSAGTAVAAGNLTALVGVPITFGNAVRGTIGMAQATIQASGTATAVFTSSGATGSGSADATVDAQTVTASLSIVDAMAPVVTSPAATTLTQTLCQ